MWLLRRKLLGPPYSKSADCVYSVNIKYSLVREHYSEKELRMMLDFNHDQITFLSPCMSWRLQTAITQKEVWEKSFSFYKSLLSLHDKTEAQKILKNVDTSVSTVHVLVYECKTASSSKDITKCVESYLKNIYTCRTTKQMWEYRYEIVMINRGTKQYKNAIRSYSLAKSKSCVTNVSFVYFSQLYERSTAWSKDPITQLLF